MSNFESQISMSVELFNSLTRVDKVVWNSNDFACVVNPPTTPVPTTSTTIAPTTSTLAPTTTTLAPVFQPPSISITAPAILPVGVDEAISVNLTNINQLQFELNLVVDFISIDKTGYAPNPAQLSQNLLPGVLLEGRDLAQSFDEVPPINSLDIFNKASYAGGENTSANLNLSHAIYNHGHRPFTFLVKVELRYMRPDNPNLQYLVSNAVEIKYEYLYPSTPVVENVYNYKSPFNSYDLAVSGGGTPLQRKAAPYNQRYVYGGVLPAFTTQVVELIVDNIPLNLLPTYFNGKTTKIIDQSLDLILFPSYELIKEESYTHKIFYQASQWIGTITSRGGDFTRVNRKVPHADFNSYLILDQVINPGLIAQIEALSSRKIKVTYLVEHPSLTVIDQNSRFIGWPIVATDFFNPDSPRVMSPTSAGTGTDCQLYAVPEIRISFHIYDTYVNDSYKQSSVTSCESLDAAPPTPAPVAGVQAYRLNNFTIDDWTYEGTPIPLA